MANAKDPDDETVEQYLNVMAAYEGLAASAGNHWRAAFIELAQAKVYMHISPSSYDHRRHASMTVCKGRLVNAGLPPLSSFGPWPASSLRRAQAAFAEALEDVVAAHRLVQELDALEQKMCRPA